MLNLPRWQTIAIILVTLFAGLLATSSGSTWLNAARLALGVLLLLEGFLLAKNWRGSRQLVLWRLQRRRPPIAHRRA